MNFKINTKNINTSYQHTNNKNSKTNSSFANQLKDSINISTNKLTNTSVHSNLSTVKNVSNNNTSTDYSNEEIEKRRAEIHKIQDNYDNRNGDSSGYPKFNTKVMEKVLDLQIQNNKDTYYDSNGKLNINKVADDCGISLNNVTPIELQSLRRELNDEHLIANDINHDLENFIDRACLDNFSKGNCSQYDAYNNIKFNVLEKANYFMKIDSKYNELISYNIMNSISNLFK